jgi:hypothetical protein
MPCWSYHIGCWSYHWHACPAVACWSYHWHAGHAIGMLILSLTCWSCHRHAGPAMNMLVFPMTCMSCYWHAGPSTGTHVLPFACWLCHWHARFSVPIMPMIFFLKYLSAIHSPASWRSPSCSVLLTSFLPLCHYSLYNYCISHFLQISVFVFHSLNIGVFTLLPINVHNFMNRLNMSSLFHHLHNSIKLLHCCPPSWYTISVMHVYNIILYIMSTKREIQSYFHIQHE